MGVWGEIHVTRIKDCGGDTVEHLWGSSLEAGAPGALVPALCFSGFPLNLTHLITLAVAKS